MSTFMDMMTDMLPVSSELQKTDNPLRRVLDKSVGAYMDELPEIFDELFLTSAAGGWLDAFGKDYGVSRRLDETDDSYRERIIFEKLEYLTAHNLQSIYNVGLFNAFDGFNPSDNDLTSDNNYLTDFYMGVADTDIQNILNKKFIFDSNFIWFNGSELDYIINTSNIGVLKEYIKIYDFEDLTEFFKNNTAIKSVKLDLPNAKHIERMFQGCTGLVDVKLNLENVERYDFTTTPGDSNDIFKNCSNLTNLDLNLPKIDYHASYLVSNCENLVNLNLKIPSAKNCSYLLSGCFSLKNATLDLSSMTNYSNMLWLISNNGVLEKLDVIIPESQVTGFKSYVLGEHISTLDTFIVNGEEVDLS